MSHLNNKPLSAEELLPCLLCKGQVTYKLTETYSLDSSYWGVRCDKCDLCLEQRFGETEAELFARWNTRAQVQQAAMPVLRPMEEAPEGRFVAVYPDGKIDVIQRSARLPGKFQRDTGFVLEPTELKGWFDHRILKGLEVAAHPAAQGKGRTPEVEALEVVKKAKALKNFLFKSLNAGPLTNGPSQEAKLLRELYAAIDGFDAALQRGQGEVG